MNTTLERQQGMHRRTRLVALGLMAALALGLATSQIGAQSPRAVSRDGQAKCVAVAIGLEGRRCLVPGSGLRTWFRDCPVCPELVVVPAAPRDRRRKPFAVGRFAVTFEEWDACLADGSCNAWRPADEGWGRGNLPVVNVSWDDANAYARWLSLKTGRSYRLLRDHEREHVARAGTTTAYWWGDGINLEQANYDVPIPTRLRAHESRAEIDKVRHRSVAVDSFAANAWGLFNVHGNVWEWTADCQPDDGPQLAAAPKAASIPCGARFSRGGSWNDFADAARSASRVGFSPGTRNPSQGFRIARELP